MRLKWIFRHLIRDKLNSVVIIISLALGMACFDLVLMFISHELKTDGFQIYKEQIYALKCDDPWIPGKEIYYCKSGSAEYMKENFPQVEDFCRIKNSGSQKIIANGREYLDNPPIIVASGNFFSFFSYSLITNNPSTALESKFDIVISESLSKKYFGNEYAVGKVIQIVNSNKVEDLVISGIFKKPLENSQLTFEMVRPISETDSRCYIRLGKGTDPEFMEKLFLEKKESIPIVNTGEPGHYLLEPFIGAYFDTSRGSSVEVSRSKSDLWLAFGIGLMIMVISIFNFLGILNNKFHSRLKGFYVRRINGSSRFSFLLGFMSENAVIIGCSFLAGLYLMMELIPFFNILTGSNITVRFIFQPGQISALFAILISVLLITMLYAYRILYYERNLYILLSSRSRDDRRFQIPVFNIFQIAGSILLIIFSLVIIKQMRFVTDKNIGLDKNVIEVRLPGQYADKISVFKEELLRYSSVANISVVSASPLLEHFLLSLKYERDGVEKRYSPAGFYGDDNYLDVLGIQLVTGQGFSDISHIGSKVCLVNETLAKFFSDSNLIGKGLPGMKDVTVVGIVKDFNYSSLKTMVEPSFISYNNKGNHLLVKATENQISQMRNDITTVWNSLVPDFPPDLESIGARFEWYHRENKNFIRLIGACSAVSIFLSMIGLFAISFQRAKSRTKEIGIRKINGATISEILLLINKEYLTWISISLIFAIPLALYSTDKWLENYAYKTNVGCWIIISAGCLVLAASLLTVSWQSWRAANKNPVEALRYE